MKKLTRLLSMASLPLFVIACNNSPAETGTVETTSSKDTVAVFDLAKAKAAVEAQNAKFMDATAKGDSIAMTENYSDDAQVLPSNSGPVSKADMPSMWASFIKMGIKNVKLVTLDVAGNAEQLAETGTYELFADKNVSIDKGKFVVVWKNVNGEWKIYRDIFNTSLPLAKK